jgi:hypothetical protein
VNFDRLCDEVLSLIEYDETSLLNWGFVEVKDDLDRRLPELLEKLRPPYRDVWQTISEAETLTADDVIENLLERKLIFKSADGFYRSRFAEGVRLLILLRQRFSVEDWSTAPRLVEDVHIQLQRRRYPMRNVNFEQLETRLSDLKLNAAQRQTLRILTQTPQGQSYLLAAFQQRAVRRLLDRLKETSGETGVVVGAGTGSGKTKAFYIPALTYLASHISSKRHVSVMAIYPRNELLKDQFAEAVRETERLNSFLTQAGKRKISLGAYYGDTPEDAKDKYRIIPLDQDWTVPFLRCPVCEGDLQWRVEDRNKERSVLRCRNSKCGYTSDPDHILITREQMKATPPDILFTTTETLNQRLSRVSEANLFGVRTPQPPRMLLLDEIHTYEGISGANVAYLLRRWRKAAGYTDPSKRHALCIVGLSATLSQATETFARLTGIPSHRIDYIVPAEDELEEEGMEYNLVLKSDAASGASALATGIQTVMLMGRILDPLRITGSQMTYPPKIFAFTNRLDSVNRWFDNQTDAERTKVLSQYRLWDDTQPDNIRAAIDAGGQDWKVATLIGNDLTQPLSIGRTTSQVKGVDKEAKLIVATSALEVGYNDARVGAVVQYQSPFSMAAFLQRKGRAGRNRLTRPWTIVITSPYGHDRWAFQHSEVLFNPVLKPINLPVENYYVQKIQAAYVLMDWLAERLQRQIPNLDVWTLLKGDRTGNVQDTRKEIVTLLQKLLDDAATRQNYINFLREAMGLQAKEHDAVVRSLLWGEPRPILLEVVPTVIRQLASRWQSIKLKAESPPTLVQPDPKTLPGNPMPEFVTATLFSDLNVPELHLRLGKEKSEMEEFAQTFREVLPGKVTKRYLRHKNEGVNGWWLTLPDDLPKECPLNKLPIEFDKVPFALNIDGIEYLVRRPLEYRLASVPENIASASTASPLWRSAFKPIGAHGNEAQAQCIDLQAGSIWRSQIDAIEVFTRAFGTGVRVTRGLIGVHVTHWRNRNRIHKRVMFVQYEPSGDEKSQPTAIGYALDVDGLRVGYKPLDRVKLKNSPHWEEILRAARPLLYLDRLEKDPVITAADLTFFEMDGLSQIIRSSITALAISTGKSLREACKFFSSHFNDTVRRTMSVLFQGQGGDDDEETGGKLVQKLQEHLNNTDLRQALLKHTSVFWETDPDGMDEWLDRQYAASLGAVIFSALSDLVGDVDSNDLCLDVEYAPPQFWITETTPGGVGLIARIVEAMTQHPRRLELQLMDTLRHCDREELALELDTIARQVRAGSADFVEAFQQARDKRDFISLSKAKQQLTQALETHSIPVTRPLVVAVNSKFLRPNSDDATDDLIVELVELWHSEEARLGCDIDLRVFAVAANRVSHISEQLTDILKRIGGEKPVSDNQRFNLLQSMLWMKCTDSCEDCIKYEPRFQALVRPSRHLIRALIDQDVQVIDARDANWREALVESLSRRYEAAICCGYDQIEALKHRLLELLVEPVEIGVQVFFPVLERIERGADGWILHLIIREMIGT